MNFGVTGDAAPNAAFIERGKVLLRGSGRGFLDLLGLPFAAWNRALLVGIGGDKACVDRKSIGAQSLHTSGRFALGNVFSGVG
jgi:hypothetical protein